MHEEIAVHLDTWKQIIECVDAEHTADIDILKPAQKCYRY